MGRYEKRYSTVKNDREFRFLFKKGASVVTGGFVCYFRRNNRRVNRLGIVTSKKIGGAVKRSRARRVIREAFRLLEPELRARYPDKRYDFIIVARGKTPYLKSDKLLRTMRKLLFEKLDAGEGDTKPKKK